MDEKIKVRKVCVTKDVWMVVNEHDYQMSLYAKEFVNEKTNIYLCENEQQCDYFLDNHKDSYECIN